LGAYAAGFFFASNIRIRLGKGGADTMATEKNRTETTM
jgi:hypothetical protein